MKLFLISVRLTSELMKLGDSQLVRSEVSWGRQILQLQHFDTRTVLWGLHCALSVECGLSGELVSDATTLITGNTL